MFTHKNTLKPTLLAAGILSVLSMPLAASAVEPMIKAGYGHSYGIRNDGTLFCFGACAGNFIPVTLTNGALTPEAAMLQDAKMVAGAESTAVAVLLTDGSVTQFKSHPFAMQQTAIAFNTLSGAANLDAITLASDIFLGIEPDGDVFSFGGWNDQPLQPVSGLANVKQIASEQPSLAITTDKRVLTFFKDPWGGADTPPQEVSGLSNVKEVAFAYHGAAGLRMHVALLEDGTVMQWAIEGSYQNGTTVYISHTPTQVSVPPAKAIHQNPSIHFKEKAYAITETGEVYCWGNCDNDWNTPTQSIPVQVSGISNAKEVMNINSNETLAVTEAGDVFIWGNDLIATQLPISEVVKVSPGIDHILAMQQDGTLCGWGSNNYGELGANNPNPVPMSTPVCGLEDLIIPIETDAGDCAPAEFSFVNNTLTLPTLALEVFDPAGGQSTGEYMVATGLEGEPITLKLRGVNDFLLSKGFKYELTGEVLASDDTCHPVFSMTDRLMQVPYVEVAKVTMTPASKLIELEGLKDCYAAELNQSVLLPHILELGAVTPVECQ